MKKVYSALTLTLLAAAGGAMLANFYPLLANPFLVLAGSLYLVFNLGNTFYITILLVWPLHTHNVGTNEMSVISNVIYYAELFCINKPMRKNSMFILAGKQGTTRERMVKLILLGGLTGAGLRPLLNYTIMVNPNIIPTAFILTSSIFICFSLVRLSIV